MKAGTVLFWKDFQFNDGGTSDKLVIILNTPTNNAPYLLCATTSQQHRRKKQLGCHSDQNYFFVDKLHDDFHKDTWVVFHEIYPFSVSKLIQSGLKRRLSKKFELESTLWGSLKNCILRSEDIELDYLQLISRG